MIIRTGMAALIAAGFGVGAAGAAQVELSPQQQLGKAIFFDANLSEPPGQACASCHAPETGFTSPDSARNAREAVIAGAVPGRAGNRTPPSIAYAAFSPDFHWDRKEGLYVGGQFRDGRAATLVEQAKGPPTNPLEMANPSPRAYCDKVAAADYAGLFVTVHGKPLDCAGDGFQHIAEALAAYEASREVNPFSSKYDYWLKGQAKLSKQELQGLKLFEGKAKCAECHPSKPGEDGSPPLFTDFTYDNLGGPRNPANPFYAQDSNPEGAAWADRGLGAVVGKPDEMGKVKVPTLRNVAKAPTPDFVRAYGHNGAFKSLKEIVAFYNSRDTDPRWGAPEYAGNVNREELGDLKLTEAEIDAVVAFMRTLSDGYTP